MITCPYCGTALVITAHRARPAEPPELRARGTIHRWGRCDGNLDHAPLLFHWEQAFEVEVGRP